MNSLFQTQSLPNRFLNILTALEKQIATPDQLLAESIRHIRCPDDISLTGFLLRSANPNLYEPTPGYGNLHILAVIYTLPYPFDIQQAIATLFLLSGSNPDFPVYQIPIGTPIYQPPQTVTDWLRLQNIQLPILNRIEPTLISLYNVYLNRGNQVMNPQNFRYWISLTRADTLYDTILCQDAIQTSIDTYTIDLFERLIQNRHPATYYDFNHILVLWNRYSNQSAVIEALKAFITLYIQSGFEMDLSQYNYLSQLDSEFASTMKSLYEQPRWKKECRLPEYEITGEMRQMLFGLNLFPFAQTRKEVCPWIQEMSLANQPLLLESAKQRQRQRIQSNTIVLDWVEQTPPDTCKNQALLQTDITDLPDLDLVVYQDTERSLWCFPWTMYEDLLKSCKNPYTGKIIPQDTLTEIEQKQRLLKLLNVNPQTTFSETLSQLQNADEITNRISDKYIQTIQNASLMWGMTQNVWNEWTSGDYQKMVNRICPNLDSDICNLPVDLARNTAVRHMADYVRQQNMGIRVLQSVFQNINYSLTL